MPTALRNRTPLLFVCELFEAITTGAVFVRTDIGRTKLEVFR